MLPRCSWTSDGPTIALGPVTVQRMARDDSWFDRQRCNLDDHGLEQDRVGT